MLGITYRPNKRDSHTFYALGFKVGHGITDLLLIHRLIDLAIGQHPLIDRLTQMTRGDHMSRWEIRLITITLFFMAQTNLQTVLMTGST